MKALSEHLFWVKLHLDGTVSDGIGEQIAKDEIKSSIAIVEMLGMRSLLARLEEVRDFVCGAKTDKERALDKIVEAIAIAEALPEIVISLPSKPDETGFGSKG